MLSFQKFLFLLILLSASNSFAATVIGSVKFTTYSTNRAAEHAALGTAAYTSTSDYDPAGAATSVTTTTIGAVPTSRTVAGHALTSNVTITAAQVGAPAGSGTSTGANTGDVTISTANGLSLSSQALSLAAATNSVPGAMTAADHTILSTALQPGGALGTPSSGTATNLTGTAASLTAGHVTTNANLTGPITSSGNATAVASQTGTGSKFVMDTNPIISGGSGTPSLTADNGLFTLHNSSTNELLQNGSLTGSPYSSWIQTKDSGGSGGGSGAAYPLNLNPLGGGVTVNSGTNTIYYCNGGANAGLLGRGNGGPCSGGSWVATSLKLD